MRFVAGVLVSWMVLATGCAFFGASERAVIADTLNQVEQCQEQGRQAPDGGHIAAYKACMVEAGLH